MKIVIGIGGNALLQRGQLADFSTQKINAENACRSIAQLANNHELIITHGNGPQIGLLSLQASAYKKIDAYPFDVLNAESQGMIGYLLVQQLENQLPKKNICALLTRVEVDINDPAFKEPTKFIGPTYNKEEANRLADLYYWHFSLDGSRLRRVVPSPTPQHILEVETIKSLVQQGIIVICTGGGGIPVARDSNMKYFGVEAVIDKDFSTALLAEKINADCLLFLTDVPNVMKNWGTDHAEPIETICVNEIKKQSFASGSMEPKVKASCQFSEKTGRVAHIGLLSDAVSILEGRSGTHIKLKF